MSWWLEPVTHIELVVTLTVWFFIHQLINHGGWTKKRTRLRMHWPCVNCGHGPHVGRCQAEYNDPISNEKIQCPCDQYEPERPRR